MEHFECRNCFLIGALNIHGACQGCGSQSVISQELLSLNEAAILQALRLQQALPAI